jgi:hypothetical protein
MAVKTLADANAHAISAETLYREHASFVASFLRHFGTSESDLDDIVQDVFVLPHRKGGYQPGAAGPRTWLASLAMRERGRTALSDVRHAPAAASGIDARRAATARVSRGRRLVPCGGARDLSSVFRRARCASSWQAYSRAESSELGLGQ